jgi:hypothetical protein
MKMIGEPDAGNPPVRFDEGVQETCGTRVAPAPYSTAPPSPRSCCSDCFMGKQLGSRGFRNAIAE